MYSKAIRSVVVLVLALAVPLQGTAAVTAGLCMAMGHHDAGHGLNNIAGHSAEGHHEDPAGHHKHSDADHSKPNCAPCAACCAATAIPSCALLFLPDGPAASRIAAASASFTGVSPDQLDRPPLAL